MTGQPEAITEAELADYLESVNGQRRDLALDVAAEAIRYALRNRDPEYPLRAAVERLALSWRGRAAEDPSWPYWRDMAADLEAVLRRTDGER